VRSLGDRVGCLPPPGFAVGEGGCLPSHRRSRSLRLSGCVAAGDSLEDLPAPQSRMRLAYGFVGRVIVIYIIKN